LIGIIIRIKVEDNLVGVLIDLAPRVLANNIYNKKGVGPELGLKIEKVPEKMTDSTNLRRLGFHQCTYRSGSYIDTY
jgi:hypothetical protein